MFSVAINYQKLSVFLFIKVAREVLASLIWNLFAYCLCFPLNCFDAVPSIKQVRKLNTRAILRAQFFRAR